jgi:hypothetical protein
MAVTKLAAFGKKTVTTAGTPVQITATSQLTHSILFQALSGNTGKIFIGTSAAMVKSTLVGVITVIPVPTVNVLPGINFAWPDAHFQYDLADYWLDSDNNGEGLLISYQTP